LKGRKVEKRGLAKNISVQDFREKFAAGKFGYGGAGVRAIMFLICS
jgi:hypothetical protein